MTTKLERTIENPSSATQIKTEVKTEPMSYATTEPDFTQSHANTSCAHHGSVLFDIKNLQVRSGNKHILNIEQLSLNKHQLTTFIGPNGAGKSTLLHSLLHQNYSSGLKTTGSIKACTTLATDSKPLVAEGKIAWVGQHERFELPLTVVGYALLGVSPQLAWYQTPNQAHIIKANKLLHDFELFSLKDRRVQTLSGGEKQRLAVVRALMQDTQILMLDEPTNHLDIRHQRFLLAYLRNLVTEQQKTIIMVLHDLTHAYQYSDQIVLMNQGCAVIQGYPEEVMTQANLSPIYQVDIKTYDTDSGRVFI